MMERLELGQIANRIVDPMMLVVTLGLFFGLEKFAPRLSVFVDVLLASLVSAIVFTAFNIGLVLDRLPGPDIFFARFIAAIIQCVIAILIVEAWRRIRS